MMTRQYRQGDVLLCAVDEILARTTPVPSDGDRVVLAFGELTRHAHAFAAREARLFRDEPSGRFFLAVPKAVPPSSMKSTTRYRCPTASTSLRGNENIRRSGGRAMSRIEIDAQRAAL